MSETTWRPIESAPKGDDGWIVCPVLIWADHFTYPDVAWWDGQIVAERATHWMPLPSPPSS